jgi:integrase
VWQFFTRVNKIVNKNCPAMINLSNGCKCSNPSVFPKNWKTKKASTSINWRITYRFYDPKFDKPKMIVVKGMNDQKDLLGRQEATTAILKNELYDLQELDYNPITGYQKEEKNEPAAILYPEMPLMQALKKAVELMNVEKKLKYDLDGVLKYFGMAAAEVKRDRTPLNEIQRKDIRLILTACESVKLAKGKKWSDNQFNHYRKYLSIIYNYLNREDIVEYNPVEKIEKRSVVVAPRKVLNSDQRKKIDAHLMKKLPRFHRFVNIFFHSGSRVSELLRIQGEHVELANQRFRVLIKKRKVKVWVWKTIKDIALPFWVEAMKDCTDTDFVFSCRLKPGPVKINPEQICRRWRTQVIEGLQIPISFYALKHLHTTEILDSIENDGDSINQIADHNSHTSGAMVVNIYYVKAQERKHKKIKGIQNAFGGRGVGLDHLFLCQSPFK